MLSQFEKEEDYLAEQYELGEISASEYAKQLKLLRMDYQACAEEAAHGAYQDELDNWYY